MTALDDLNTDCCRDVRLAGAWAADKDNVVGAVEEIAVVNLANQRPVDIAAGKIEVLQITIGRKAGGFEPASV